MKSLNVNQNPGFELECYHNVRLSILDNNEDFINWFHSHFVNLVLYKSNKEIVPYIRFENHIDIYSEVLSEEPVKKVGNWVDSIKKCIDHNNYVIAFLNWSNILQSRYYKEDKDMVHECLIFGYCDKNQEFEILAFDVNGLPYTKVSIPFSILSKELDHIIDFHLRKQKWFTYYGFPVSKIIKKPFNFNSLNKQKLFFGMDRHRYISSYNNNSEFAGGCSINLYLSELFQKICDESEHHKRNDFFKQSEYWKIMNLKLILHKNIMISRIKLLKNQSFSYELIKIEEYFVKCLQELKIILALSKKFTKTMDLNYLQNISSRFNKVYEHEFRATYQMLDYLVKL
ncbi:hypothetical protein [Bacillus sp. 166amftsu]|uniref:hypothetical protein n=1 Tax=Bacillus sp. 166amftsu TaxID=1761753 RepID=UPI000896403B|nr:hypothetical protein [Bacillus sp. 166amftsu]SDZ37880.1 hypothetical protein SAMN04488156_12245 [Bacillus sp. 166amftsu]